VIVKLDELECTINIVNDDGIVGSTTFTMKDAARAGLVNKDNWKNYPKNMLFARALSNACGFYCPEVVSGYYSVEELEDLNEVVSPVKVPVSVSVPAQEAEVVDGQATTITIDNKDNN
jgi:hypothetical protein